MEHYIPKMDKQYPWEWVNSIIPLEHLKEFKLSKYIDHMYHNIPGHSNSGGYVIKIPIFDFSTPEEWILFLNLVHLANQFYIAVYFLFGKYHFLFCICYILFYFTAIS